MYGHILRTAVFLALVLTVSASPSASSAQHIGQPQKLRPININNYEAAIGLQRRDEEDFTSLSLQKQSQLIYGSPGENGQLLLANMTLFAPDGLMMIMMERFEGLTSSVDCNGDDGIISLTFSSQQAYDYALQEWNYINDSEDGKFLLIANHASCSKSDQRSPYFISSIVEDATTLSTRLTAAPAPWSDVAGNYDLDFGQAIPFPAPASRLKSRGIWGDIVNVGKDVLDAAQGNADVSKTVNIPMSIGQAGQRTNIYTDDKGRLTLDCINCYVKGSFGVTGHISVQHFSLQDLTLSTSPSGFGAELELEATITSSESPDSLQYTKELFSFPVPDAGIEVEGIFKLGAILSYSVGVSSTFSGSATVDFGLQASLPDSARLLADVQNPDQSSATGWSAGSLDPIFDIKKETASLKLAAFSQPKLSFGIELIEVGNIDVGITVKLPEISVTLSAEYNDAGVCEQSAGSSQTGVKLDSAVDMDVNLQIEANLGDDKETTKPSWSKKLWGVSQPLGSNCFPMDILGLNNATSSASQTSTLPSSSRSATANSLPESASASTSAPSISQTSDVIPPSSSTATPETSSRPASASATSDPPSPSSHSLPPDPAPTTSIPPPATSTADMLTSNRRTPTEDSTTSATPRRSSSSSTAVASTSTAAAGGGGGGGCRMVKRFGKRMLVC